VASEFVKVEDGEVKKILNKAGNVQNEIITEYSVRYKSIVRYGVIFYEG